MAVVCSKAEKMSLINYSSDLIGHYAAIPRNLSIANTITLIACQMLQEVRGSRGMIIDLKDRTFVVINRSLHWLCERGCDTFLSPSTLTLSESFIETTNALIREWDDYKRSLSKGLKCDASKISELQTLLRIINSQVADDLALVRARPQSDFAEGDQLFVADFDAYLEQRSAAEERCPWKHSFPVAAAAQSEAASLESIPVLLKDFQLSLEFVLKDNSTAQKLESWSHVKQFALKWLPVLNILIRNIEKENKIQRFLPEIQQNLSQIFLELSSTASTGIAPMLGGGNSMTLNPAKSLLDQGKLWYGWSAMLLALQNSVRQLESPSETIPISHSTVESVGHLLEDLIQWREIIQEARSFPDAETVLVGLDMVVNSVITILPTMDNDLLPLREWIGMITAEREGASPNVQEFESYRKGLISTLRIFLSILEAPLLSYDDSLGLLPRKEAKSRKQILLHDLPKSVVPDLGEMPEESRQEVLKWLETFCIPLRGILAELEGCSVVERKDESSKPRPKMAPVAVEAAAPKHKKKHKKKKSPAEAIVPVSLSEDLLIPPSPVKPEFLVPSEDEESKASVTVDAIAEDEESSPPAVEAEENVSTQESRFSVRAPKDARRGREKPHLKAPVSDSEEAPAAASPVEQRRKNRDIPPRIEKFRKLRKLLNKYGFIQESGGRHLKFVDRAGGKIPVPYHGNGSIAKGTSAAIISRAKELSERLDRIIDSGPKHK